MKKNREKDPDGLNYAQIARDMGCDYRTVKAAVARIKSAGPDGQGQVELPLLEEQDVLELLLLCVPSVHIQSFLRAQTVQTLGNTSK